MGSSTLFDSDELSAFVVCFDIDNIPDISLEFNGYLLILNRYKMFFTVDLGYGIIGYLLNIQFQKNLNVAVIGQKFFTEFHTLFDPENKVLKFYSEQKDKIIYVKNNNNDNNKSNIGIIILFLIIIILIVVFFYYRNQKRKNIENNYEWMGTNNEVNFKYSNIN